MKLCCQSSLPSSIKYFLNKSLVFMALEALDVLQFSNVGRLQVTIRRCSSNRLVSVQSYEEHMLFLLSL